MEKKFYAWKIITLNDPLCLTNGANLIKKFNDGINIMAKKKVALRLYGKCNKKSIDKFLFSTYKIPVKK